jgi:hypothetical protein
MLRPKALIEHLERLILWQADLIALYGTTIPHPRSEVQYRIEGLL